MPTERLGIAGTSAMTNRALNRRTAKHDDRLAGGGG